MNKKKIILLSSGIVSLVASGVFAAVTMSASYNQWRSDYDAVTEANLKAKYTTINGVTISNVYLENDAFKPYYSIQGYYDDTVDPNKLGLKLYTYEDRFNYAELVKKEINTSKKTFKISADISMVSADGDGNDTYNNDVYKNKLLDFQDMHALYPKLVIGDYEEKITNLNSVWDEKELNFGNCTYKIKMNANEDEFPYATPVLVKTTSETIPGNASYSAAGVELERFNDDIFYILHGTSVGYNRETLSKKITFDMRYSPSTSNYIYAIRGTQGGPVTMDENGNFKLFVRVNDIPANGVNAYFARFGQEINASGNIKDLKVPGINGTTDGKYYVLDGKKYTILINHGSSEADAWGTTGLRVEII